MESTEWHPVPNTEGLYEITREGAVRRRATGRKPAGKPLSVNIDRGGYPYGKITLSERQRTLKLHRALAETFIGPAPRPGMFVLHADDNSMNFSLDNLRWGTQAENVSDARRNGGIARMSAARRAVTHCKRGHEFTPENTRLGRAGKYVRRICRTCHREREYQRNHV